MVYWWVSWWHESDFGPFTLYTPWWVSGGDVEGNESLCAMIKAESEEEIENIIYNCYDNKPENIQFRFINQKPFDWHPSDRFPFADWMNKYWFYRDRYIQEE